MSAAAGIMPRAHRPRKAMRHAAAIQAAMTTPELHGDEPLPAAWESFEPSTKYFKLSNDTRRRLLLRCHGEIQIHLALMIIERTWGGRKIRGARPAACPLSYGEMVRECDGRWTEQGIILAVAEGLRRGLFQRHELSPGNFVYRVPTPTEWDNIRNDDPGEEKAKPVMQVAEDDPEPEVEGDGKPSVERITEPLVVMPGKRSRPMPLSRAVEVEEIVIRTRDGLPCVSVQLSVRNRALVLDLGDSAPVTPTPSLSTPVERVPQTTPTKSVTYDFAESRFCALPPAEQERRKEAALQRMVDKGRYILARQPGAVELAAIQQFQRELSEQQEG